MCVVAESVSFYFLLCSYALGGNRFVADVGDLKIGPKHPVLIMGVINLSPESFYKGSIAENPDEFLVMLERTVLDGADIIDVGGASTAPKNVYSTSEISREEEITRVTAALESMGDIKQPISIDTTSAAVAEAALDLGASMVNDVSGFRLDSEMAELVADRSVPVVLMANCGAPCTSIEASLSSLEGSLAIAREHEIDSKMIILDPGIGFGKPPEVDFEILRNLDRYADLGFPLLVGVSRKAFIGHVLEQDSPDDRLIGTIAATAIAVMNGANIIRAHDVKDAKIAARLGSAMRKHWSMSGSL